ncbi:MAG: hypothetical protein A2987_02550 [Omnitrophica bacterium RIFCSPLOWO2_01_FULL_45_10]|nr:MAG: hypothetical protein A2987_02550 [Omnitrophica bacterium RIFCSPLOWO2_01_FULL_45_10]
MSDLDTYFARLRNSVDKRLNAYLPSGKEAPRIVHRAMRYSVFSGGKRIRPILAIEACLACGGRVNEVLPIACAIELIHTYSLIHDDLPSMDDDDYRRNKLACHKVFGESIAILAGDSLLPLAFNIVSKEITPKIGLEIIKELSGAVGTKGMTGGQALDLEFFARGYGKKARPIKPSALNRINRLKTSRLFEASTRVGAIVTGAKAEDIDAIANFGAAFGSAFQILDDIIDGGIYPEIFGMRKARNDVKILLGRAKGFLRPFGRSSERLNKLADYLMERADIKTK